jgi:hypothetical protein
MSSHPCNPSSSSPEPSSTAVSASTGLSPILDDSTPANQLREPFPQSHLSFPRPELPLHSVPRLLAFGVIVNLLILVRLSLSKSRATAGADAFELDALQREVNTLQRRIRSRLDRLLGASLTIFPSLS